MATLLRIAATTIIAAPVLYAPAFAEVQPSHNCTGHGTQGTESACYSMEHGGTERTFRLYIPATHKGPLPLVLVLHGGGGDGAGMENLTERGFNRIADRDGALIVYPDGVGRGWNDGRTDLKSKAVAEQVDDIGFLRALPREISSQFPVDTTRVFATGISNGGLMSYRLACDAADIFAAVAPVAANMSVEIAPRCHPAREVSMLVINGTDDPIMPWKGGTIRVLWAARGTVLSTRATVDRWVELDRCGPLRDIGEVVDQDPGDGTSLVKHSARCSGRADVTLFEIRGGGHTWPDGRPYLGPGIVGRVSRELNANGEIWEFFRQHPASFRN